MKLNSLIFPTISDVLPSYKKMTQYADCRHRKKMAGATSQISKGKWEE